MRRPALTWRVALGLTVAVLAAYWPALSGSLLWDDDAHVTRPDLRSIHGLWRIWAEPGATQQYYPLLHSAFWVEHRLWGDATLGYHLVNIGLHVGICVLLFMVLRRLSVPGAVLGVFAFALHPVCAESVAWISEQKNTLSGFFYMAAALAYLRYDEERSPRWYAWGLLLFICALLSKSVTATLPGALLVVLWWKRGRLSLRTDLLALAPWLALGALSGAMTAWVERSIIGAHGAAFDLSLAQRVLIAGRAAWFYLGKLLWPEPLVALYPRWEVDAHSPGQWAFPVAAVAAMAVLFALRGKSRGPFAAALLFAGTLFPALGFFNVYPFVFSFVADHFQYLAAAAMIPALAAGLALVSDSVPARVLACAGVVALGTLTWLHAGNFRDQRVFYSRILEKNPDSWLAHANLGVILGSEGDAAQAESHYEAAERLNPGYPEAFNNYGNLLAKAGQWTAAEEQYAGALRANPSFAAADFNWGYALGQAGRYPEAEPHLRNAIRLLPNYTEAHYELGNALANAGRLPEAESEYRAALSLRPDYPEADANLGLALAEREDWSDAVEHISRAVAARPAYAEAHAYLGFALAGSGRHSEALAEFEEALRRGPDNPDIHYQMALSLERLGRPGEARAQVEEARRLQAQSAGHQP